MTMEQAKNKIQYCPNHPNKRIRIRAHGLCSICYHHQVTKLHPEYKRKRREYQRLWRKRYPNYYRDYYRSHPEARKNRDYKKRYGISLNEYQILLGKQNGVCAICRLKENNQRFLSVDHNHITGQIRGLLCQKCNAVLGMVNDNTDLLLSAKRYLVQHNNKTRKNKIVMEE